MQTTVLSTWPSSECSWLPCRPALRSNLICPPPHRLGKMWPLFRSEWEARMNILQMIPKSPPLWTFFKLNFRIHFSACWPIGLGKVGAQLYPGLPVVGGGHKSIINCPDHLYKTFGGCVFCRGFRNGGRKRLNSAILLVSRMRNNEFRLLFK